MLLVQLRESHNTLHNHRHLEDMMVAPRQKLTLKSQHNLMVHMCSIVIFHNLTLTIVEYHNYLLRVHSTCNLMVLICQ